MVLFAKALANAMGFQEQNNRLAERKADRPDRSYDFPIQPNPLPHGRYRGRGRPRPGMPYTEPAPLIYRKVDDHHRAWVSGHQLDGLRRDIGPRIRPPYHHQPVVFQPAFEYPRGHFDYPSWDEYVNDPYGSYWEPDESFVDSFDNLSLGRRHSFERVRPPGFEHHRQTVLPHHHLRDSPLQDQEDHHPYHDRHRPRWDHPHQHDRPLRRGHHRHHHSFDSEIDGEPGGNRVSGMWERDPYGVGHGMGHEHSTDASSEHGSASTW